MKKIQECVFFIRQRSKMMRCSAPSNTSNQVIWYTIWKLIPLAKWWCKWIKKWTKNEKVTKGWMLRGVVQIFKKQVYWLLFGKPYDIWPSKLVCFLMTTYTTCVPNFVKIWEGHYETLVEVIWNDPYMLCILLLQAFRGDVSDWISIQFVSLI